MSTEKKSKQTFKIQHQIAHSSPCRNEMIRTKELHQMVHFLYYGEILDVKDTRKIIKNLIDILGFPDDMDLTISCNVCNQKISYRGEDVLVCTDCNMEVRTHPPTEVPNDKVHKWFTISISIF